MEMAVPERAYPEPVTGDREHVLAGHTLARPGRRRSSPDTARPAAGPARPGQDRPGNLSGPGHE